MKFLSLDAARAGADNLRCNGSPERHRQLARAYRAFWRSSSCSQSASPIAAIQGSTRRTLGFMAGFDLAALIFLRLLPAAAARRATRSEIRDHANANDANRAVLLEITGVVMRRAAGGDRAPRAMGNNPGAFHQRAHHLHARRRVALQQHDLRDCTTPISLTAMRDAAARSGLDFPGTPEPDYWDFVYFAFTCGMAFATSDVQVTEPAHASHRHGCIALPPSHSTSACSRSP